MAYKQLKLWFDGELAKLLADKIQAIQPEFNHTTFIQRIVAGVGTLELKDRVELISDALYESLGDDYQSGVQTLMGILGPENTEETGMFSNFYWVMPIAKYIEKFGLHDFSISMHAIEEVTKRNTGEYCIRPFIKKYPVKTMEQMMEWSMHQNFHVRRLASEGGRPRLPWASKLDQFIEDPGPLLPILDNLKDDTSKYVQKSVANCLNDILKDNPQIAKEIIDSWLPTTSKRTQWVIRHSLRRLLKNDDLWARRKLKVICE